MPYVYVNEDAELFRVQFHDSEIAKIYAMRETKLRYLRMYGNISIPEGVLA